MFVNVNWIAIYFGFKTYVVTEVLPWNSHSITSPFFSTKVFFLPPRSLERGKTRQRRAGNQGKEKEQLPTSSSALSLYWVAEVSLCEGAFPTSIPHCNVITNLLISGPFRSRAWVPETTQEATIWGKLASLLRLLDIVDKQSLTRHLTDSHSLLTLECIFSFFFSFFFLAAKDETSENARSNAGSPQHEATRVGQVYEHR